MLENVRTHQYTTAQLDKAVQREGNETVLTYTEGLRKKLCKQYLTTLDKAKITGISLI